MRKLRFLPVLAVLCVAAYAGGTRGRFAALRAKMQPTRTMVFKQVKGVSLKAFVFEPEDHKPTDKRPAIVFFFGGGWVGGNPAQFFPQCKYLASRGMVAISAEYRVKNRHGVTPFECVADAKSAVRWVRANAGKLGIDPARIAAGGGSAGGHVAACTGTIPDLDEPGEDKTVSSRPNAMVLFNPALFLDLEAWKRAGVPADKIENIRKRFGGRDPREISPFHHIRPGLPLTIIFHGENDTTVPIVTVRRYVEAAKKAGNRCELVAFPGQGHGFFNFGRGDAFRKTLERADRFLASLGWLEGEPTVDKFLESLKQD